MAKITISHLMDDHLDLMDIFVTELEGSLTVWNKDVPLDIPLKADLSFLFAIEPRELKELKEQIERVLLQRCKDYPSLPQYGH